MSTPQDPGRPEDRPPEQSGYPDAPPPPEPGSYPPGSDQTSHQSYPPAPDYGTEGAPSQGGAPGYEQGA
ncbi:MAG TPA: hypothetical protein VNC85_11915, partial [Mycobacteriales bacterium]|nr:hypothetical protein [Mycobacteriales bacterium]